MCSMYVGWEIGRCFPVNFVDPPVRHRCHVPDFFFSFTHPRRQNPFVHGIFLQEVPEQAIWLALAPLTRSYRLSLRKWASLACLLTGESCGRSPAVSQSGHGSFRFHDPGKAPRPLPRARLLSLSHQRLLVLRPLIHTILYCGSSRHDVSSL